MLLPSLTLQIRQCCWKSVPCPACNKKPITATKKGRRHQDKGHGSQQGLSPSVQPRSITANATVFLPPKNSPGCQCFSSGYRYTCSQGKKTNPSSVLSLSLVKVTMHNVLLASGEPGQCTKDTQSQQQTQDKIH